MADKKRQPFQSLSEYYWDGLDNAAKIFPAVSNSHSSNVFRISAILREDVDPALLQTSVEQALRLMPAFAVKLHRGLFWYYLDSNSEKPKVREEKQYPCAPIFGAHENGYLFRVTYYRRHLNLDVFHALSDGTGAVNFLYAILYSYFGLAEIGDADFLSYAGTVNVDFDDDSFARNAGEDEAPDKATPTDVRESEAYRIKGYKYDGDRLNVLTALMPADKLLALARERGVTLSEFLTALLIWSIYNTSYRRSSRSRPIVISLPVNLRGLFDSRTLRNFFGHINISIKNPGELGFDGILTETRRQLKERLSREYFEKQMAGRLKPERIPGVRFVPIWIKNRVLAHYYKKAARGYTCTLSNMGRLILPEAIADKVERFDLLLGSSDTHPKKVSVCSFGNTLSLSFTSTVDSSALEKFMITSLVSLGIDATLISNDVPAPPREKKPPKKGRDKKERKGAEPK